MPEHEAKKCAKVEIGTSQLRCTPLAPVDGFMAFLISHANLSLYDAAMIGFRRGHSMLLKAGGGSY